MNHKPKLLILVVAFLIGFMTSCNFEWEIAELYSQPIQGTSKVLYKYDAWGGRDSHSFGYRILDSTENFNVNSQLDLPFYYLEGVSANGEVKGVSHRRSKNQENDNQLEPIFVPIEVERFFKNKVPIVHKIYQYKGFARRTIGFETFSFESFLETEDSLYFFNLDMIERAGERYIDTLKFKKTCIVLRSNKESELKQVVIEDLVLNEKTDEVISNVTWVLTPKNKTNVNSFSNQGIFKEITVANKK